MKNRRIKEADFIFSLMCELLQEVAPEIKEDFISLKEDTTIDYQLKRKLLDSLESKDISKLIKAFTLYYLLLNIIDERYFISLNSKAHIKPTLEELKSQQYDEEDIKNVLRKIKFYPVFTAHPTESLRRTFLESYHEMYDDLNCWFQFQDNNAKEHLKYRLNLLWYSHIVRSEKIEVLFELDNLLYFMESSILQSGVNVLEEVQNTLQIPLKKSPIRLGSWIGGDRDGNPYVTNGVMIEVMKRQHQTIIEHYLKQIDKLSRELSIAQEYSQPTQELLDSLEREKDYLDDMAKKLFLQEPFRAKLTCMRQKLQNRILALNLPQSALYENKPYMYENSKEFIKDIDMMIESLDKRSGIYLRKLKNLVLLAGFHLMQLDFKKHHEFFW